MPECKIPNEIWLLIASHLPDYDSILQLSLCSKRMSRVARSQLFRLDDLPCRRFALEWAAGNNDMDVLQLSYDLSRRTHLDSARGNKILQIAIDRGHIQIVDALITKYHLDISLKDRWNRNSLQNAMLKNRTEVVKRILFHGASPSAPFSPSTGKTPLHFAMGTVCFRKQAVEDIAMMLINAGADIEARDYYGRTPLAITITTGYIDYTRLLLAQGATVTHAHVHQAIEDERENGMLQLLIEASGTPIDEIVSDGYHLLLAAIRRRRLDSVRWLLALGANPNLRSDGTILLPRGLGAGSTPMLYAIKRGYLDLVQILLANGADAEMADDQGLTPVRLAMERSSPLNEALPLLFKNGADVNGLFSTGHLPITLAAQGGDLIQLQILVENGADLNAIDGNGNCAICVAAAACNSDRVIELLCDNGANVNGLNQDGRNALHFASRLGRKSYHPSTSERQRQILKSLFKYGIELYTPDRDGRTPLHLLAAAPFSEPVEWLLQANPDVNAQDKHGLSPLCYAVGSSLENTQLLIDHGADVNVVTRFGQRPLTLAAMTGATDTMKLVFENMEDTTAATTEPDAMGRTPLFYAVMTGYLEPCQTAANQLAKKNVPLRDIYGTTPAMIAARNGQAKILGLLLNTVDCQIYVPDNDGLNLLQWAARGGHEDVWALLNSHMGTNLDASDFVPDDYYTRGRLFTHYYFHCIVCGRCTVHGYQPPSVCTDCQIGTSGFIVCHFCVENGVKCLDSSHAWDEKHSML